MSTVYMFDEELSGDTFSSYECDGVVLMITFTQQKDVDKY